jgi:drug/metabolite transporter (DMT)-like permease
MHGGLAGTARREILPPVTTPPRHPTLAYAALAASGILWGSSFILGKIALRELSVDAMILDRFLLATLTFLPLLIVARPSLERREWLLIALAAVVGVPIQFLMQFEGLARTTASHAALMIGTAPVLVAVSAFVVLRERIRPATWIALLVSTVGVAMIVLQARSRGDAAARDGATLAGDLLVLFSMFAAVVWILVSKHLMARHSPIVVTGLITTLGTLVLAPWVIMHEGMPPVHLSSGTWAAVLALGLVTTTMTTILWNWGLSQVQAGKAGVFINLEPVVGAILGVWLLHEHLSPLALLGGIMIFVAAVAVSLMNN